MGISGRRQTVLPTSGMPQSWQLTARLGFGPNEPRGSGCRTDHDRRRRRGEEAVDRRACPARQAMIMHMAIWMHSVALPVGVSLATTIVVSLSVGPRLAARSKRIQAAHDSRDRFSDSVLDILALCGNLRPVLRDPAFGDPSRSQLQCECKRWEGQIDETTAWLVDHWQRFALGYLGARGARNLIVEYVASARGVWLSARPLDERVRLLEEMTEPIQTIFFARRWRVIREIPRAETRLRATLASVKRAQQAQGTAADARSGDSPTPRA